VLLATSAIPFLLCGAGALVIAGAWALDRRGRGRPMPERRRHAREESADPVMVLRDRRIDATFAIDVSLGGVLIAGPADLERGDKVVLQIAGAERAATVVRVTAQGHRALIFD
jgi:PilZ domain